MYLLLAAFLSGCGGTAIKEKTVKTDLVSVKYPVVVNIKDKEIQEKINFLLYQRAFEFLDQNAILKGKALYKSVYDVSYRRGGLISIKFMEMLYSPWNNDLQSTMKSITFNINDGTVYTLDDIFIPDIGYKDILNGLMKEVIKRNAMLLLREFKGVEKNQSFYLSNDGLVVYYQPGIYTPREVGPLSIVVIYPNIKGILRKGLHL